MHNNSIRISFKIVQHVTPQNVFPKLFMTQLQLFCSGIVQSFLWSVKGQVTISTTSLKEKNSYWTSDMLRVWAIEGKRMRRSEENSKVRGRQIDIRWRCPVTAEEETGPARLAAPPVKLMGQGLNLVRLPRITSAAFIKLWAHPRQHCEPLARHVPLQAQKQIASIDPRRVLPVLRMWGRRDTRVTSLTSALIRHIL